MAENCKDREFYDTARGSCRACANACSTCSNTITCDTCDKENCVCKANQVVKNCIECSSQICNKCKETFILSNNQCSVCPEGCNCNLFACISCKKNFFMENGSCKNCDASCNQCTGGGSRGCVICAQEYGVIDGSCQKCEVDMINSCQCGESLNCATCKTSDSSQCETCKKGSKLDTDGKCTVCDNNYYKSGDTCVLCDQHTSDEGCTCGGKIVPFCKTCVVTGQTCGVCQSNQLFIDNSCQQCPNSENINNLSVACPCSGAVHCGNCNVSVCGACLPGYYFNHNQICIQCNTQISPSGDCVSYATCQVANCLDCLGSDKFCRKCNQGFKLGFDGLCWKQCQVIATNGHYCDTVGNEIKSCDQAGNKSFGCICGLQIHCDQCTEDFSACATCLQGYKLNSSGSCSECIDGWLFRSGSLLCYQESLLDIFTAGVITGLIIGAFILIVTVVIVIIGFVRRSNEIKYSVYKIKAQQRAEELEKSIVENNDE